MSLPSPTSPTPGSGTNLPHSILLLSTFSAVLATGLSVVSIGLQVRNYRKVMLQRLVVRILVMVPLYSLSSLISLYSLDLAFFIDAFRDVYEAFVIYCFFTLLIEYLGGERSIILALHGRPPIPHPFPISLLFNPLDASDPFTFLGLKRGVLQYVQVKPILAGVTVLLKATGTYKDGDLAGDSGYTYISVAYNLSVILSLYCLGMFWAATSIDLRPFRPTPKFLCVKGIIFFSFWQGLLVSILVALGWIHSSRMETEKLALAIQDALICCEMPLFAFMHLYAFSHTDYIDPTHLYSGRLPALYALRDAFGYKDIISDSSTTLRGTGFSYRTFEPPSSSLSHSGPSIDRRLRAGLRFSASGGQKYWLPTTNAEESRKVEGVRRGTYEGIPEEGGREYDGEEGYGSDDGQVEFGELEEEEEMESLYLDSRSLEFGDYNSPVIDASKESARRQMFLEEQARLHPLPSPRSKGKKPIPTRSTYGSYSNPPPIVEEEDTRPTGSGIVQVTSDLLSSMQPSNLASTSSVGLPDDAVDLVVKDLEAEEAERARERRRGEVGGRGRGVYKVVYHPSTTPTDGEAGDDGVVEGEGREETVVVEREEGRSVVEIAPPPPQLQLASQTHGRSPTNPWS